MSRLIDRTGQKINRLTFIKYVGKSKWLVRCDCGTEKIVNAYDVESGNTKSCGCYNSEINSELNLTHGKSKTKEYKTWGNMRKRCLNTKEKEYKDYGARGIIICDRWLNSFENFLEDMGLAPTPNHSIDRINNDGNYEPSNCRWATRTQQNRNYSRNINITINDETRCLAEWCEILNRRYRTIYYRIKYLNWDPVQALLK